MDRCHANPRYNTVKLSFVELTFSVNVADAMQFWTSNILKSAKHRVLAPLKQRYSLVYFVGADPETVRTRYSCLTFLALETDLRQ